MLLRFACSNFRSIKEKQEILFTAAKHVKEHDEAARTVNGLPKQRVLPVVALYGANASGKSNMLKALEFLKRAALRSHVDWEKGIDRQPFRLDPAWKDEPSSFEIDFLVDGVRYHYGFVCDDEVVREEWLYAKPPGRVLQTWFNRKIGEETEFGKPIRVQGEALRRAEMEKRGVLILSLLLQSNSLTITPILGYFSDCIFFVSVNEGGQKSTKLLLDDRHYLFANEIIKEADTGIESIDIDIFLGPNRDDMIKYRFPVSIPEFYNYSRNKFVRDDDETLEEFDVRVNSAVESLKSFGGIFVSARFLHKDKNGEKIYFDADEESYGTVRLFNVSGSIGLALKNGLSVCIDELDSSLHTLLSRAIIRLFMDPKTNPKGAQLLFTTHDTNLLSTDVLRRDQVWLTEKDQGGATHSYPLSDFKTKPTDDIEAGYLAGRFGAIPYLPPWRSLIGGEG